MIARVLDCYDICLYHGDAVDWPGEESIDLVLTNPYGPMPTVLSKTPMILHQWAHKKHQVERWAGLAIGELQLVATWNSDRECFWVANMDPIELDLRHLKPEPGGWYPLEVPLRLLETFAKPASRVWDGFMGRGTVARAAHMLGHRYVGVEQLRAHIDLAAKYLDLPSLHVTA